jgi:hypothetical protein
MFWARARLRARDRRPYLAVTEDVATANDHGALPTIVRAGMDDVPLALEAPYRARNARHRTVYVYLYTH